MNKQQGKDIVRKENERRIMLCGFAAGSAFLIMAFILIFLGAA